MFTLIQHRLQLSLNTCKQTWLRAQAGSEIELVAPLTESSVVQYLHFKY